VKRPSSTIVVDAAIFVAAARGRSSGALLAAAEEASLVTTDWVVQEAWRRIRSGLKRPELLPILDALFAETTVMPVAALQAYIAIGETVLRDAVPSRNGSTQDAHLLALAWVADADIWSTDRDFAGTGVATWSTPDLIRGFVASDTLGGG
jgi:predicted nucleic acid-binding protein